MAIRLPVGSHARIRGILSVLVAAGVGLAGSAHATFAVRPGETLWELAARHGVSVGALAAANGITDLDRILAGQVLRLPGPGSGPAAPRGSGHTVASGDTLTAIGARYGVSVADLVAANDLASPHAIRAGQRLSIPDATPRPAAAGPRAQVGALIERTARAHGWNPALIKAVAWQESGWNNRAVSTAGAVGIMQVLPSTGRFVSDHLVGRRLDLTDPADNVLAGVAFLDYLHDLTGSDTRLTLAGYYQGLRSMRANGVYPDTERYVDSVLALRRRF
ncbi:MAG: LysM peptidoglycan-binding domain-containing protein [Actinomycetota bacterium]|nr:LysM peptidoglycan-binding domain-containing protein [Actinomycetota bacterium]